MPLEILELPHHLKTRIDFIEDPCPFSIQSWERLVDVGMPLALDMGSDVEHQPAISSTCPSSASSNPHGKQRRNIFTNLPSSPPSWITP
ncbi:MAG: hypothetical protein ACLSUW_06145 [Akkermansia sp.]